MPAFRIEPAPSHRNPDAPTGSHGRDDHAVLVHLHLGRLPQVIVDENDLPTLEGKLREALAAAGTGEYESHELGAGGVTLFMYGPDAEALFGAVEPVLREYPLCKGALVVVRRGGPETRGRVVHLDP